MKVVLHRNPRMNTLSYETSAIMALFKKKKAEAADAAVQENPFDAPATAPEPTPTPAAPKEPAAPKLKVRPDVYTLILGLAALAMTIACIFLYLGVAKYGPNPISGVPRAMLTWFAG